MNQKILRRPWAAGLLCGLALVCLAEAAAFGAEPKPPIPPEIKAISEWSASLSNIYSGANAAVEITKLFLDAAGVIDVETEAERFQALHEHLDQAVGALDWHLAASFRDRRLAQVLAAIENSRQAIELGTPLGVDSPAYFESLEAVTEARLPAAFQRTYSAGATDIGDWQKVIEARPEHPDGLVYDWRLGVPALMQLIALRLQVIAGIVPDFRVNGVLSGELLTYRQALLDNYQAMLGGIRCEGKAVLLDPFTFPWTFDRSHYCADIHTGISAHVDWLEYDFEPWVGDVIAREQPRLEQQIRMQMPLFEMRQMIDLLYLLARGGPDLTAQEERISLSAAPDLCLDVQYGNPAPGTPTWLWPCDGNDAQRWEYDRESGRIRNPAYDKCLEVQGGNFLPGTPVGIGDCTGGEAQSWTWDPEKHVLQNALGTVAGIPERGWMFRWWWEDNLRPQAMVVTQPRTATEGQQWFSHPAAFEGPTTCGYLTPGQGLRVQESVTSCDGRFILFMQDDGNLVLYRISNAWHPLWATNTEGNAGASAAMRSDGSLVVYNPEKRVIWSSGTTGYPDALLAIQDDGNLVVYSPQGWRPRWASDTCCH